MSRQPRVEASSTRPVDLALHPIETGNYRIATTLRALVEREHDRILVSFDPNVRLNVGPDLTRWRKALPSARRTAPAMR